MTQQGTNQQIQFNYEPLLILEILLQEVICQLFQSITNNNLQISTDKIQQCIIQILEQFKTFNTKVQCILIQLTQNLIIISISNRQLLLQYQKLIIQLINNIQIQELNQPLDKNQKNYFKYDDIKQEIISNYIKDGSQQHQELNFVLEKPKLDKNVIQQSVDQKATSTEVGQLNKIKEPNTQIAVELKFQQFLSVLLLLVFYQNFNVDDQQCSYLSSLVQQLYSKEIIDCYLTQVLKNNSSQMKQLMEIKFDFTDLNHVFIRVLLAHCLYHTSLYLCNFSLSKTVFNELNQIFKDNLQIVELQAADNQYQKQNFHIIENQQYLVNHQYVCAKRQQKVQIFKSQLNIHNQYTFIQYGIIQPEYNQNRKFPLAPEDFFVSKDEKFVNCFNVIFNDMTVNGVEGVIILTTQHLIMIPEVVYVPNIKLYQITKNQYPFTLFITQSTGVIQQLYQVPESYSERNKILKDIQLGFNLKLETSIFEPNLIKYIKLQQIKQITRAMLSAVPDSFIIQTSFGIDFLLTMVSYQNSFNAQIRTFERIVYTNKFLFSELQKIKQVDITPCLYTNSIAQRETLIQHLLYFCVIEQNNIGQIDCIGFNQPILKDQTQYNIELKNIFEFVENLVPKQDLHVIMLLNMHYLYFNTEQYINYFIPQQDYINLSQIKKTSKTTLSSFKIYDFTKLKSTKSKSITSINIQLPELSNYQLLNLINHSSQRYYQSLSNYPIYPWIWEGRDLQYMQKAQTEFDRVELIKKYEQMQLFQFSQLPSSPGAVVYYNVRMQPFELSMRQLQGGIYDSCDRMFRSTQIAQQIVQDQYTSDVKEYIDDLFQQPIHWNINFFNFGKLQNGDRIDDVNCDDQSIIHYMIKSMCQLNSKNTRSQLHKYINMMYGVQQRQKDICNIFPAQNYCSDQSDYDTCANFGVVPRQIFDQLLQQLQETQNNLYENFIINIELYRKNGQVQVIQMLQQDINSSGIKFPKTIQTIQKSTKLQQNQKQQVQESKQCFETNLQIIDNNIQYNMQSIYYVLQNEYHSYFNNGNSKIITIFNKIQNSLRIVDIDTKKQINVFYIDDTIISYTHYECILYIILYKITTNNSSQQNNQKIYDIVLQVYNIFTNDQLYEVIIDKLEFKHLVNIQTQQIQIFLATDQQYICIVLNEQLFIYSHSMILILKQHIQQLKFKHNISIIQYYEFIFLMIFVDNTIYVYLLEQSNEIKGVQTIGVENELQECNLLQSANQSQVQISYNQYSQYLRPFQLYYHTDDNYAVNNKKEMLLCYFTKMIEIQIINEYE